MSCNSKTTLYIGLIVTNIIGSRWPQNIPYVVVVTCCTHSSHSQRLSWTFSSLLKDNAVWRNLCCQFQVKGNHVLVLEPIPCDYSYHEIVFTSNFERWTCQSDARICCVCTHQSQGKSYKKTQIFQVQACNTPILNKELENFVWNFSHKCCNKCVPKTIHMLSYPYPLSNRWENRLACHIGYNEL
jgi:hypothetical protein